MGGARRQCFAHDLLVKELSPANSLIPGGLTHGITGVGRVRLNDTAVVDSCPS